ncbi:hypothetical protein AYK26_04525 [Euryarchaeota archaeon SM23-78]|nr:MAG: hypothetical protein AYK26_04525 [Euryarchaeota archaeon SM23-78]
MAGMRLLITITDTAHRDIFTTTTHIIIITLIITGLALTGGVAGDKLNTNFLNNPFSLLLVDR